MNLKHQLQYYLRQRNITASELARRTGVPKQSISDWLAGVPPRSIPRIKLISEALQTSFDELCFGDATATKLSTPGAEELKAPDMYITADARGLIVEMHPRFSNTLGWSAEEIRARPFTEFMHVNDRHQMWSYFLRARKTGSSPTVKLDNRFVCKDGAIVWFRWNALVSTSDQNTYALCTNVTNEYPEELDTPAIVSMSYLTENILKTTRLRDTAINPVSVGFLGTDFSHDITVECRPAMFGTGLAMLLTDATGCALACADKRAIFDLQENNGRVVLEVRTRSCDFVPDLRIPSYVAGRHFGTATFDRSTDWCQFKLDVPSRQPKF